MILFNDNNIKKESDNIINTAKLLLEKARSKFFSQLVYASGCVCGREAGDNTVFVQRA